MNLSRESFARRKVSANCAAVYIEAITSPKSVPKKKRIRMIAKEMESILDDAQEYLLRNLLDEDLGDEAKNALFKAAMESAYFKHNYDTTENKVVFYPTCKDLILHHGMIDDAEKYYYSERDRFPPEYREALEFVVREYKQRRQILLSERREELWGYGSDQDSLSEFDDVFSQDLEVHCDPKVMEELSNSWTEKC